MTASRRPWIFTLLFWAALTLTVLTVVIDARMSALLAGRPGLDDLPSVVAAVLVTAVVIGCWRLLPWTPPERRFLLLVLPGFLAGISVLGYLNYMTWAQGLFLVAVANGVFVLGFRRGTVYALVVLVAAFVAGLSQRPETSVLEIAYRTGALGLVAVLIGGVCQAVVEARQGRATAARLLAELEERTGRIAELSAAAERTRLTRDIHDTVGHHLTVANLQLVNSARLRGRDDAGAWGEVEGATATVRTALTEVRRAVRALPPAEEDLVDLPAALAALVGAFRGGPLTAHLRVNGAPWRLVAPRQQLLYRAAQEGLTNAAKHSEARTVVVTLTYGRSEAAVRVVDDGPGAGGPVVEGFGLASLRSRAATLGGRFGAGRTGPGFALEVAVPYGGVDA